MTKNILTLTSRLSTLANFRYALHQFLRFSGKVAEEEAVSVQHYPEVLARLMPVRLAELDAHGPNMMRAMEVLLAQSAGGQAATQNGDFEMTAPIAVSAS